ncbi:MAG: hypothetical protein JST11_20170 [Acidobacteria bacterium]|nr:hypothetical protein [Acidobacteriota bacterium]
MKSIVLWRAEVENQPGVLAATMEASAKAGADFQLVMGYRHAAAKGKAVIEVYPVAGRKLTAAAGTAGLAAAPIPALLVEGDNRPGLGYAIAQALGAGGINLAFFIGQVIGRKFSAVAGFEAPEDAKKASPLIRKAAAQKAAKTARA